MYIAIRARTTMQIGRWCACALITTTPVQIYNNNYIRACGDVASFRDKYLHDVWFHGRKHAMFERKC